MTRPAKRKKVVFEGYTTDGVLHTTCWAYGEYLNLGVRIYKTRKEGSKSFPQTWAKVRVIVEVLPTPKARRKK